MHHSGQGGLEGRTSAAKVAVNGAGGAHTHIGGVRMWVWSIKPAMDGAGGAHTCIGGVRLWVWGLNSAQGGRKVEEEGERRKVTMLKKSSLPLGWKFRRAKERIIPQSWASDSCLALSRMYCEIWG